ncbi:SNF2 family N-terminal domain-containing protein [Phanerochaete sordida]|uniref:Chromatin-remodeling ATPase INO80 n=1 Tax=Phanerochaete sordida TaxID=48140 RepID=A0A9P3L9R1_9APHY|nr:SNF2 family N-terminal domain-containing protein [Phanerochaete sordida]
MSLRHILNDDSNPPTHSTPSTTTPATINKVESASRPHSPAPMPTSSAPSRGRRGRGRARSSPPAQDPEQPPAREFTYQTMVYQGPRGEFYPEHEDDTGSPRTFNGDAEESMSAHGHTETNGRRKRRTGAAEDQEYQPPGTKRRTPRRNPPRGKQTQPPIEPPEVEPPSEQIFQEPTEEERRLASSDLEDCPEIWQQAMGTFVMDSRKRQRQIEQYFNRWIINRDSTTAYSVSHSYVERISRIPPPPPPLPPPQPPMSPYDDDGSGRRTPSAASADTFEFIDYSYHHGRNQGAAAANELEESLLGRGSAKSNRKRPANGDSDDDSSEADIPIAARHGPLTKKRRIAKGPAPDSHPGYPEAMASMTGTIPLPLGTHISGRGKGKAKQQEDSVDSASATPRGRKRPSKKSLLPPHTQEALGLSGSISATASRDITPAGSRAPSPALTTGSAAIWELDEVIPALKKARRIDDAGMWKRVKSLEDMQRKIWTNIAKRDIVKVYRYHTAGYQARQAQTKRVATQAALHARKPFTRTAKGSKDVQAKGKRLMREMLVFWKKNEKEERDVRRREQREALDRAKVEEEKREAARQARKLEFLISQTELYSHFVGNKLKTAQVQGDEPEAAAPAGAHLEDAVGELQDIDFDDEDQTNIHRHARRNAQEAIALARTKAQSFDAQSALERKTNEALKLAKAQAHIRAEESVETSTTAGTPLVDLDSDELNFQNPTSLTGELTVKQPNMLMTTLKEYQLKGLNWLATLYEQGINGILADEMGLGKTVQSISLLAYLAETHDIWGPFLVVSPASTLHNWQQEITRFVPKLKALPYWGSVKDRATLRKFWSRKDVCYTEDAPFHVLITSYQLVTQDQQHFQRIKWQYMILDEAQNIKNSSSARWKTLLGFQCRNRLLLTGTPIQNSMQELWALLHFIMPSLFDSHDEFNEWFSKDIENAAENKGSKLNEHQLRRLHMILKPFMLRRVKRHVQNELSEKIEVDIHVEMSARQRQLYDAMRAKVSVTDLLEKAASDDLDSKRTLMNLVMQFRKVVNHPELFERADVTAPFSFSAFGRPGPLSREGDFVDLPYSTRNPIDYEIPRLLYEDGGLLDVPREDARLHQDRGPLATLYNIWSTDWIQKSEDADAGFSFLRFANLSPSEAHDIHLMPAFRQRLAALRQEAELLDEAPYIFDSDFVASAKATPFGIPLLAPAGITAEADGLPGLLSISTDAWTSSCLSRKDLRWFIPPVVAPPVSIYCTNRNFLEHQATILGAPLESLALYGLPPDTRESVPDAAVYEDRLPGIPITGLLQSSPSDQLPSPPMQVPEAKRLIYDSGKLARLDALLHELKAGDHKVLVYFQMTRMMDLMEEYLIYRQYKYLRLDGSSKLEDRRDMVMEWQTRPDIFVFLLSTRAGGLGINLTAADTVVFYDHDWNPSNDAQAMDRAHRLGQTRQVTVYRLITKGTIDERIVQMARVKKDVQDIVVGNKTFTDVAKPSEIVQLLLSEDQLANLDTTNVASASKKNGKRPAGQANGTDTPLRDLWNEEGDEFFGQSGPMQSGTASIQELDDDGTPVPTTTRRRGKGDGTSRRGRKPGPKPGRKRANGGEADS